MSAVEKYLPLLIAEGNPDGGTTGVGVQIGDAIITPESKWQGAGGGDEFDMLPVNTEIDIAKYPALVATGIITTAFSEIKEVTALWTIVPQALCKDPDTNRVWLADNNKFHSQAIDGTSDMFEYNEIRWNGYPARAIAITNSQMYVVQYHGSPQVVTIRDLASGTILSDHATSYGRSNGICVVGDFVWVSAVGSLRKYTKAMVDTGEFITIANTYDAPVLTNIGNVITMFYDRYIGYADTVAMTATTPIDVGYLHLNNTTGMFENEGYTWVLSRTPKAYHVYGDKHSTPDIPDYAGSPFPWKIVADLTQE